MYEELKEEVEASSSITKLICNPGRNSTHVKGGLLFCQDFFPGKASAIVAECPDSNSQDEVLSYTNMVAALEEDSEVFEVKNCCSLMSDDDLTNKCGVCDGDLACNCDSSFDEGTELRAARSICPGIFS